jgi:hypothetical protein
MARRNPWRAATVFGLGLPLGLLISWLAITAANVPPGPRAGAIICLGGAITISICRYVIDRRLFLGSEDWMKAPSGIKQPRTSAFIMKCYSTVGIGLHLALYVLAILKITGTYLS